MSNPESSEDVVTEKNRNLMMDVIKLAILGFLAFAVGTVMEITREGRNVGTPGPRDYRSR